jgi:hypothetical protein
MKRVILLWSAIWLFGSCSSQLDTMCSVFMQPAKDKRSLLKMGFVHPAVKALDSVAFTIPAGAAKNISKSQQKWNDNLLTKRINDTDVIYTFRNEDLIGVQILVSHVDPTKLFNLLDTLGFKRIGPAGGPRQVFANKQANIRYEMFLVTGQAIFTDQILRDDGTGKAQ